MRSQGYRLKPLDHFNYNTTREHIAIGSAFRVEVVSPSPIFSLSFFLSFSHGRPYSRLHPNRFVVSSNLTQYFSIGCNCDPRNLLQLLTEIFVVGPRLIKRDRKLSVRSRRRRVNRFLRRTKKRAAAIITIDRSNICLPGRLSRSTYICIFGYYLEIKRLRFVLVYTLVWPT